MLVPRLTASFALLFLLAASASASAEEAEVPTSGASDTPAEVNATGVASGDAPERAATEVSPEEPPLDAAAWRRSGPSVYAGFLLVPGDSVGGANSGVSLEGGWHVETPHVWIEPRLGVRFSPYSGPDKTAGLLQVLLDLRVHYYFLDGPFSPYVGGGVGMHFLSTQWLNDDAPESDPRLGESFRERGWGAALNLGAGVQILRRDDVRLTLGADYHALSLTVRDKSVQHMLTALVGVHF